jgi:hypothetical protein
MNPEKALRRALRIAGEELAKSPAEIASAHKALGEASTALDALLEEWSPSCKAPLRDWSDAFRAQAANDLRAVEVLLAAPEDHDEDRPWSTVAMLFQMVFEKIAKAALALTDRGAFEASMGAHASASRFIKVIGNNGQYTGLRKEGKELFRWVRELERAHPALSKSGGHLEYPWEEGETVKRPSQLWLVTELGDPTKLLAPKLAKFARKLLNDFDRLFG